MKKKTHKLVVLEKTYPNGAPYKVICNNDERIGSYMILVDGFLPQGCRKVIPVERDAQIKVIQRYISDHIGRAAMAAGLYDLV